MRLTSRSFLPHSVIFCVAVLCGAAPAAWAAESPYDSRVTAAEYTRAQAEAGDRDAMYAYAQSLEIGAGVDQDLFAAARWFSKAAVAGHPQAESGHERCLNKIRMRTAPPAPVVVQAPREVVYAPAPVVRETVVVGGYVGGCYPYYRPACHSGVRVETGFCWPHSGLLLGLTLGGCLGHHRHHCW